MVLASRLAMLALCWLLAVTAASLPTLLVPLLALTALAAVVSLPLRPAWSAVSPLVEGALAAAIVASQPSLPGELLPYLLVPPLAAGLLRGAWATLLTSAVIAASLAVSRGLAGSLGSAADRTALVQWVGLGVGIGLVGAWGRWSTLRVIHSRDEYREANRLLTQLRDLARTLPTGFDEIGIGAGLLDDLVELVGADEGTVSTLTDSGRLVPLTSVGPARIDGGAGTPEGLWQQALDTGAAVTTDQRPDGTAGALAVLPLRLGQRRIGAVAVSRRGAPFTEEELGRCTRLVDDAALRLDTGRLFSDVPDGQWPRPVGEVFPAASYGTVVAFIS